MSCVYFIQAGASGPIKIGVAIDPQRRLDWLQVGHPEKLYLRAVISGGYAEEAFLHGRFKAGRLRGEWFDASTPGLASFMAAAKHLEFFPEDDPEKADRLCSRCEIRTVGKGRRTRCDRCAGRVRSIDDPSSDLSLLENALQTMDFS